jgi:hypothetical protein
MHLTITRWLKVIYLMSGAKLGAGQAASLKAHTAKLKLASLWENYAFGVEAFSIAVYPAIENYALSSLRPLRLSGSNLLILADL